MKPLTRFACCHAQLSRAIQMPQLCQLSLSGVRVDDMGMLHNLDRLTSLEMRLPRGMLRQNGL